MELLLGLKKYLNFILKFIFAVMGDILPFNS